MHANASLKGEKWLILLFSNKKIAREQPGEGAFISGFQTRIMKRQLNKILRDYALFKQN